MIGQQDLVRAAVEEPLYGVIYEDTDFADRNVYYHSWPGKRLYVKVVIRLEGNPPEGEIISAYGQFGCKGGEKPIWPPSLHS